MLLRLLSLLSSRAVLASGALHVGLAAGMASGGPPHAMSGGAEEASVQVLEVDTVADDVEKPAIVPERRNESDTARVAAAPPRRAIPHEHPFVVPGHEARAHDPAARHGAAEPAAASELPAMPSFTLPNGGSMTAGSTRVAPAASSVAGAHDGSASGEIHGAGDVDVPAKVIAAVTAVYPEHARETGLEVDVVLDIIVDDSGRVAHARTVQSGDREVDDAALAAIRQYRFSPAQRRGRPVRVRMTWTVQFRLR